MSKVCKFNCIRRPGGEPLPESPGLQVLVLVSDVLIVLSLSFSDERNIINFYSHMEHTIKGLI